MRATPTAIPDVLIIEPKVFGDERGFFFESFNQAKFEAAVCRHVAFVQGNHLRSVKNVLLGLHYQFQQPQGKPALSAKDRQGNALAAAEHFE